MRELAISVIALIASLPLHAAEHCVREDASGVKDGSTWDDAWTNLPSALVRGDTYYIADGTYGDYICDDAASGNAYIFITKATAAEHGSETGWLDSYGDGAAEFTSIEVRTAYWDIDGATGTGFESRGIKVTYSGLYGAVMTSSTTPANKHHLRFRSLELITSTNVSAAGLYFYLADDQGSIEDPNLLIENVYSHGHGGLHLQQLSGNYLIYRDSVWDTCAQADTDGHKEMMKWDSTNCHVRIYGNVFKDWQGYSVTGGLVIGGGGVDGSMTDWQIYNNVFYWTEFPDTGGTNTWSGGNRVIGGLDSSDTDHDDIHVWNNTFLNITNTSAANIFTFGTWTGSNSVRNNLFVSCPGLTTINEDTDWNAYYDCDNFSDYAANDTVLAGDPLRDSSTYDARLNTVVPGLDLSSAFTTDITGRTRSGTWDIGAYEYGRLLRTTTLRAGNVTGP